MAILYAPLKLPQNTEQQQPRQGMYQPDFYLQQQQAQQPGPTSLDFVQAQMQRLKQRNAPPVLTPGSRAKDIPQGISDPSNFQSYYKQLSTIKQIGQEQLAHAEAQAAIARLKASQALNSISAANPAYNMGGGGVPATSAGSSGSAGGRAGSAALPSNPRANFNFAQNISGNYGWNNPTELAAWYTLGMKESGWNNNAQNKTSTAYGIGQFLNSTWGGYGIAKTSDPALQVEAMARYIKARYGSPSKALAFHIGHNWY